MRPVLTAFLYLSAGAFVLAFNWSCQSPTPTSSTFPQALQTVDATLFPTVGSTPVPITTFPPTPISSSCGLLGNTAPASAITPVALPINNYVAYEETFFYPAIYPFVSLQSFDNFNVFAANSSATSTASLELAVYAQSSGQQLLADATLSVPPLASRWFTVSMSGAVTTPGAVYLVAHALTNNLSVGTMSTANSSYSGMTSCEGDFGTYTGSPLPSSLPLTGVPSPCYALNAHWCTK
jgi:hypothetical protein